MKTADKDIMFVVVKGLTNCRVSVKCAYIRQLPTGTYYYVCLV